MKSFFLSITREIFFHHYWAKIYFSLVEGNSLFNLLLEKWVGEGWTKTYLGLNEKIIVRKMAKELIIEEKNTEKLFEKKDDLFAKCF